MKKISSRSTLFNKVFFPIIWFGFCVVLIAIGIWGSPEHSIDWVFVGGPFMFMVVGYVLMKAFIFDLMDEVFDAGDSLIVRNKGRDIRVVLKDIKNVSYQTMSNHSASDPEFAQEDGFWSRDIIHTRNLFVGI